MAVNFISVFDGSKVFWSRRAAIDIDQETVSLKEKFVSMNQRRYKWKTMLLFIVPMVELEITEVNFINGMN